MILKFRAWDEEEKRFYYSNDDLGNFFSSFSDLQIDQYTGLKDKNGKEIYDGDIVKTEHGVSGIVEWIDGVGYRFNCNEPMWRHPIHEMGGEKEIIGNIYENPELLK